jgi:hypothetical protein
VLCTFFCHNHDTFFWLFLMWDTRSNAGSTFGVANSTCESAMRNTSYALEQVLIEDMTTWEIGMSPHLAWYIPSWNGPYYWHYTCSSGFWKELDPKVFHFPFFFFKNQNQWFFHFLKFQETGTRVITSVARFLNAHPILKPVLTMRTENWFLYIYMGELDKFSHRIYILCQLMLLLFLLLFSPDELINLLINKFHFN